jgi:hypothetical protein
MTYTVTQTSDGAWLVEAVAYPGAGGKFSALFYGLNAEERARNYAAWMNAATY